MAAQRGQNLLLPAENALQAFGSNRLIDDFGGRRPYQPVGGLSGLAEEVAWGRTLKVKGMPNDPKLKRFRVRMSAYRTDGRRTHEAEPRDTAAAEQEMRIKHFSQRPLND